MESNSFIDYVPKIVVVKSIDENGSFFRFNDFSGVEQSTAFDMKQVYFDGKRNFQLAIPLSTLKARARHETVRAEVVRRCAKFSADQKWFTICLFVGQNQAPAHSAFVPNFNIINHDQSVRYNEKAISLGPAGPGPQFRLGMAKLETGEMIIVNKNVFFDDGRPMKNRFNDSTERLIESGQKLNVDLAHIPDYYYQRFPMFRDFKYITTLVWVGEKPASSKMRDFGQMVENTRPGNVILLCNDPSGISTSGFITPCNFENKPDNLRRVRVWFDRRDAYLYGTCLENVNLALFYSDYATVNVYFENDPVPKSALDQIRRFWGNEADSYTYVRAKYVTKGNVLPEDLLFENKESRFHVSLNSLELKMYLKTNHKLSTEDFEFLANPPPSQQQLQLADAGVVGEGDVVRNDVFKAKVFTLKKPRVGMVAVEGLMTIDSDKFKSQWALVKRWNMYIFGHCLESANLMDFILPTDVFNIEVEVNSIKGLLIKTAWIGPMPTYRMKRYPPDPDSFSEFRPWLEQHQMRDSSDYFTSLKGKIPLTPFFPLLPREAVHRHLATVHALHQIPAVTKDDCKTFGLLRITKGPMEGEILPFMPDDLYILDYNVGYCNDLSRILNVGDQLSCEVRKLHATEMSNWTSIFNTTCNRDGSAPFRIMPRFLAYLVYLGNRPFPPQAKPSFTVISEVRRNDELSRWLTNKRLSPEVFSDLVCGNFGTLESRDDVMEEQYRQFVSTIDSPPVQKRNPSPERRTDLLAPQGAHDSSKLQMIPKQSDPDQLVNPFRSNQSPDRSNLHQVSAESNSKKTNQFISLAETLTHRIMNCVTLEDPNIQKIVLNDADLDLAMFMSKSLVAAIMFYTKKKEEKGPETAAPTTSRAAPPPNSTYVSRESSSTISRLPEPIAPNPSKKVFGTPTGSFIEGFDKAMSTNSATDYSRPVHVGGKSGGSNYSDISGTSVLELPNPSYATSFPQNQPESTNRQTVDFQREQRRGPAGVSPKISDYLEGLKDSLHGSSQSDQNRKILLPSPAGMVSTYGTRPPVGIDHSNPEQSERVGRTQINKPFEMSVSEALRGSLRYDAKPVSNNAPPNEVVKPIFERRFSPGRSSNDQSMFERRRSPSRESAKADRSTFETKSSPLRQREDRQMDQSERPNYEKNFTYGRPYDRTASPSRYQVEDRPWFEPLPTTERRYDDVAVHRGSTGYDSRGFEEKMNEDRPPQHAGSLERIHEIRRLPLGSPAKIRSQSPSRPPMTDLRAKLTNRFKNEGRPLGSDYGPSLGGYGAEKRPSEMGNPYGSAKIQRNDDYHRHSQNY